MPHRNNSAHAVRMSVRTISRSDRIPTMLIADFHVRQTLASLGVLQFHQQIEEIALSRGPWPSLARGAPLGGHQDPVVFVRSQELVPYEKQIPWKRVLRPFLGVLLDCPTGLS
jgi:hypothetical protein